MTINREKLHAEAVESWVNANHRALILMGTGVGKNRIYTKAIKSLKPKGKILILVNSEDLRDSELQKEFVKWRAKTWLRKIEFMCYQSAYKLRGKHYGLVIGDEIDFAIGTKYWDFFVHNTFDALLLGTATLPEEKEEFIKQVVPITYRYSTQDAQNDKILNSTKFWFVNYLLSEKKTIQKWYKNEEGKWEDIMLSENDIYLRYNERISALMNNIADPYPFDASEEGEILSETERNEALSKLTLSRKMFLNTAGTNVQITLRLKDHILLNPVNRLIVFSEFTTQSDKISKYSYHSNAPSDNLNRFNNEEIREIAVCGKVNRGMNLTKCNNAIFEGFSRSKVAGNQRIGRLTRLDVNDVANVYIMIPHYQKTINVVNPGTGEVIGSKKVIKRTCIFDYAMKAFADFKIEEKAQLFKFPN